MPKISSGLVASLFADEVRASLGDNSPKDQAYLNLDRHFTQHVYSVKGTTDVVVMDTVLTLHIKGDQHTIPSKLRKLAGDVEQAAQDFERLHPAPSSNTPEDTTDVDTDTLPTESDVDALSKLDALSQLSPDDQAWYDEQDRREEDPYSRVTSLGNPPEWDDERGEDEEDRVLSEGYIDRQTGRLFIEY